MYCANPFSFLLSISLCVCVSFRPLGTWRWSRRYRFHRLLPPLQALHSAPDAKAGERSAQSHRFGLHTGTR